MDINEVIGGVTTTLTVVFIIAPALVGLLFDYSAKTYMGQVKAGLILACVILGVVALCFAVIITIGFMSGNFDVVSDILEEVGK